MTSSFDCRLSGLPSESLIRSARKRREKRFLFSGNLRSVALGFLFFYSLDFKQGHPGLFQHYVTLDVQLDAESLTHPVRGPSSHSLMVTLMGSSEMRSMRLLGAHRRKAKRQARKLISSGSGHD